MSIEKNFIEIENVQESKPKLHIKSRTEKPLIYPNRFPVPDDKVDWSVGYEEYDPPYFVAPVVLENDGTIKEGGWADPEDISLVSREYYSYEGDISVDSKGRPLNPMGRTGIEGRGLLGKWGPNFAADPIITRENPEDESLELLLIKRGDSGKWALPGGMVDAGERMSATASRELEEEAGISVDMSQAEEVYRGYVDDPRNTDHAWMETAAYHYHLSPQEAVNAKVVAGDDAVEVDWKKLTDENIDELYASHKDLVMLVIKEEK